MAELFGHPLFQAALWFAAIFALLALAILALRRWRGGAADDRPRASELLTKFRELHLRGGLSDDEYRTIKTKLASQIDIELKGNNQTS
ncbi:MAG: hypothetical protein WD738_09355 [Pirellulales bacterium]